MSSEIKHGDFTTLAEFYRHRVGYSPVVLSAISKLHNKPMHQLRIADVGAGTGKLTENLCQLHPSSLIAIEPNDAMRAEGQSYLQGQSITWQSGSGENTGLPSESVDWLLMGSSFHWVDLHKGLAEFRRVLAPGGIFTCLWNPRDLERSELQSRIDQKIKEVVPELQRVSSGAPKSTQDWYSLLVSTGDFRDAIFMEAKHEEHMSFDRYIGAWLSVNDIQVQAGEKRWAEIVEMIENEVRGLNDIVVPYSTRAWTVWRN